MLLNIFYPISISVTPIQFLGSLRSLLLGTGTCWTSCNSVKSVSSNQQELKKFIKVSRFCSSSNLNALGGTLLSPGDLPFDNFVTDCFNYFQDMSVLSSIMKCHWGS